MRSKQTDGKAPSWDREHRRRSERGSAVVFVALFMVALFGFAALSLDVSNVYLQKHRMHAATDAAALAGVAKVGDPSVLADQQASDAIRVADAIANTNGVIDAEIAAAVVSNAGAIQVGLWDGSTFTANATDINGYNAVRVPAQRTVSLNFGQVVGLSQMTPAVDSIAAIGGIATQYGVPSNVVADVAIGGTITLQLWKQAPGSGSGNWGPVNLCGLSLNGNPKLQNGLTNGGCFAAIGEQVPTITGDTVGIKRAFETMCGQIVVMPVVTPFPTGRSDDVTIVDYIVVQFTDPNCSSGGQGTGANWTFQVTLLGRGWAALQHFRTLVQ